MKPKLIAASILLATSGAVAFYPAVQSQGIVPVNPPVSATAARERPVVDVVFVLDTTSSMTGLIQAAKEKIWSIATTLASAQPAPEIRLGLVAFRDRGDAYVTRVTDLSTDLDSVYAQLMDFRAQGGGDGPESVNQALYEAVHHLSWSQNPGAYRAIFLVGDAPPHMDYADDVKYPASVAAARSMGIRVNAIQAGRNGQTLQAWQQVARLGLGEFLQVDADGSAVAIATPFDEKLADLSRQLDGTRLYYGSEETQASKQRKLAAAEKLHAAASLESRARRATFNASASGRLSLIGDDELVEDVVSGRVELASLPPASLPEPLRAVAPERQAAIIAETAARRGELQRQIEALADQRAAFLRESLADSDSAEASLDNKLYRAIRGQAEASGLRYEADVPAY
jgi:Mg-chelatase subunit ChlD